MKKLIAIAGTGILLMMAVSTAQSHTWLAKYQNNPVPDDVNVPQRYLIENDGTFTIDCCGCHGQHPGVPVLMCK